jgi:hypothetical protein
MSSLDQTEVLRSYVVHLAREMIGRNPNDGGSEITEDRHFIELFGCGTGVVVSLWALRM